MRVHDLNIGLPDTTASEFAEALLFELVSLQNGFSTHAMSDRTIFLQGKKEMLDEIIDYLKKAQP